MRGYLIGGAVAALSIATAAIAAQTAPPPGVAQGTAPPPMAAPAPPRAPQMRVMFGGDHVMTRDEVSKHVAEMFAKLDTNHDGFVTKQEVEALHAQMEAKMQAAMARAGDVEKRLADSGVFVGDRGAMFDRLDTNHDGNISRQEFMAGRPNVHQERVMIMNSGGAPGAPDAPGMNGHMGMGMHMHHMGGMGMGMGGFGMRLFDMADANHDGRVSLAEAQSAALAHFDKADLNHDGKITPDERMQMHKEMHVERRGS